MTTFRDMVEQVRGNLNQFLVNRDTMATFANWVRDAEDNVIGVALADTEMLTRQVAELETGELLYLMEVTDTGVATVPTWFRGFNGTPQEDDVTEGSAVRIDPQWPTWSIMKALVSGIRACTPALFGVGEVELSGVPTKGQYEIVDTSVEHILRVETIGYGPRLTHQKVGRWSFDRTNPDGKKYLHLPGLATVRPIRVTYAKSITFPDLTSAASLDATWASTGLPSTASDLPVLYATGSMAKTLDVARLQMQGMEQADKARFAQGNPATTAARWWMEEFDRRLAREREHLARFYPPAIHRET